jgi:hypothetical protein
MSIPKCLTSVGFESPLWVRIIAGRRASMLKQGNGVIINVSSQAALNHAAGAAAYAGLEGCQRQVIARWVQNLASATGSNVICNSACRWDLGNVGHSSFTGNWSSTDVGPARSSLQPTPNCCAART